VKRFKKFIDGTRMRQDDHEVLMDIRELLYLLVVVADQQRNAGVWPPLRDFVSRRMEDAE
jgi:hypothetical protein